jgi:hypothetical protein
MINYLNDIITQDINQYKQQIQTASITILIT